MDGARRVALRVDAELVEAALDEPPRVGLVVDRELARVAEPVRLGAQHPRAGGVEGHDPHRARAAAEQQLDALAHLLRRLVRERDREDLVRARHPGALEEGDPMRQHARLARARAGEDQQRALAVRDGLALGRVEAREQVLDAVREAVSGMPPEHRPGVGGTPRHGLHARRGSAPILAASPFRGRQGMSRGFTIATALAVLFRCGLRASGRCEQQRGCARRDAVPTAATLAQANERDPVPHQRRARAPRPRACALSAPLTSAAVGHSADMVAQQATSPTSASTARPPASACCSAGYFTAAPASVDEALAVGWSRARHAAGARERAHAQPDPPQHPARPAPPRHRRRPRARRPQLDLPGGATLTLDFARR